MIIWKLTIDVDSLREDLKTYYGTAREYNPAAVIDLIKVEEASDEEIINIAKDNNINLYDYEIRGRSR